MLKQRVTLTTKKIERYEARCQQFRQNLQFNSNQRRFYQNLGEGNNYSTEIPDKEETSKFWENTGENLKEHKTRANWIESTQSILINISWKGSKSPLKWSNIKLKR